MTVLPQISSSLHGKPFLGLIVLVFVHEDLVLNACLWLLLGVLFRLPHIKVSVELEAAQLAAVQPRRHWIR